MLILWISNISHFHYPQSLNRLLSENIFQVVCPLCGDLFDQETIEAHADTCGEDGAIGGEVNF
jgi:hypothetical protein